MTKKNQNPTEDQLHKIPLRITDTTLRDAHQSLWATRMRTDDMLRIIDVRPEKPYELTFFIQAGKHLRIAGYYIVKI